MRRINLMKRFTTYTDESGISTRKKFIVATALVDNEGCEEFQELLSEIEKTTGKKKKWADVGVMTRTRYTRLLLKKGVFNSCTVYFSVFNNKQDYISLVSSQVAKSIINHADGAAYKATIFLDLVNNRMTEGVQKELKSYKIRYKKIRALDDTNNVGLKFIDAMCGLIRDIENSNIDPSYKTIYKKLKEI